MKKILPVALLAIILCTLIFSYLLLLNDRSGADLLENTFTSFNHGNASTSNNIFKFWQEEKLRLTSVSELIRLDYLLMIIYFTSFFFILYQLRKANSARPVIKNMLLFGMIALVAGTAIDALQDGKIFIAVKDALDQDKWKLSDHQVIRISRHFSDMRWFTYPKFTLLILALLSAFTVLIPKERITWQGFKRFWFRFFNDLRVTLSQFLKCIWVFFPGIFFLLLGIAAFWLAGQGKDIIVAFTRNITQSFDIGNIHWSYSRIVFFLAIAFWAYVSWYSSRIIFYMKLRKQEEPVKEIQDLVTGKVPVRGNSYPDIQENFMIEFPRMIGNACFLILELAMLQSPMMILAMKSNMAMLLFAELLVAFYFVNRWMVSLSSNEISFKKWFNIFGLMFLFVITGISFLDRPLFAIVFVPIVLLHIIYIFYINLHRRTIEAAPKIYKDEKATGMKKFTQDVMEFFCLPLKELGYYKWFIYTSVFGTGCYFLCVHFLKTARVIGPFPFILLAFSVLLAFGNTVTAFSVKYKLNFHFILLLLASFTGLHETHRVRTNELKFNGVVTKKMDRPDLKRYLKSWLNKNKGTDDTSAIHMYFVMSNGGASRSGFWSAAVLGRLQDSTLKNGKRFSDQLFCLSGTSGGGVGVASFFSVMGKPVNSSDTCYEKSMESYLKQDYFTYTFARLLSYDYFHYVIPFLSLPDRAAKLEESFEESSKKTETGLLNIPFASHFSSFAALRPDSSVQYPLLFINTTRVQDGTPGVVTNLAIDSQTFNARIDVMKVLADTSDVTMATGSILGARFPYLSPAGRLADNDFVDGGYFDNSGAGVVQELIRGIVTMGISCRRVNNPLGNLIKRIHFHVLHIVNSPIEYDSTAIKPVTPIKNDLLAPVLTILGAYDMQTTVNDGRLYNYLNDLNSYDTIPADYARISLYQSKKEWASDTDLHRTYTKEPSYAMNWFMSDTTADRIMKRLKNNDSLKQVIKNFR